MGRHTPTPMDRARDELFSHVIRCDVLDARMDDRLEWLDETMDFMAQRHPHLTDLQLAQLDLIGRRFIKPAIPHGAHATSLNRNEWTELRRDDMTTMQQTRKEWIETTKAKLDEMDEALSGLEKRASDVGERTADELDARIDATRRSLTAARQRWAGVKSSAADAWAGVSDEVSTAWDANRVALERSIEEIRSAVERVTA